MDSVKTELNYICTYFLRTNSLVVSTSSQHSNTKSYTVVSFRSQIINIVNQEFSQFFRNKIIYIYIYMPLTHSTRLLCPEILSMTLCPVISSKRTTPKEYTSVLVDNFPLSINSGAMYPGFIILLFLCQFFNSFLDFPNPKSPTYTDAQHPNQKQSQLAN